MRLYPFHTPIKSLYFRSFVVSVLFARFHFKVIRKSLYANVAERKQGKVSERWSSRIDARRRKKKKFRKQRQLNTNVEGQSLQSSEAKIKPVSSSSFGLSKKRKAVQQEPDMLKR